MASRLGDMGNKTILTVTAISGGITVSTSGTLNDFREPRFVEFIRSGTRSLETLLALDKLQSTLEMHKVRSDRGIVSFLGSGFLEMMFDQDGNQYIRTLCPIDRKPAPCTFLEKDTPQLVMVAVQALLKATEKDARDFPQ